VPPRLSRLEDVVGGRRELELIAHNEDGDGSHYMDGEKGSFSPVNFPPSRFPCWLAVPHVVRVRVVHGAMHARHDGGG